MIAFRMKLQSCEQPNGVSFLLLWQAPPLLLSTFSGKTTVISVSLKPLGIALERFHVRLFGKVQDK